MAVGYRQIDGFNSPVFDPQKLGDNFQAKFKGTSWGSELSGSRSLDL